MKLGHAPSPPAREGRSLTPIDARPAGSWHDGAAYCRDGSLAVNVGKRDNERVNIARALAHQAQFSAAVAQVALPPQVLSVTSTLGTDWNGESAVFFDVILADNSVPRPQLLAFTKQISRAIVHEIRPLEEWGVLPYFNFLTESEQARMKEPTWA
jgi:hypothetical protein